jgi:hypothetical protein
MYTQENKFQGLLVGACFTIFSLLSIYTFIIPILSVLPGVCLEGIVKIFVDNIPYSNVGNMTVNLLAVIFILSLLIFLTIIYLQIRRVVKVSKKLIIGIMVFEYFIIHSLGFYYYWGLKLNFRGDGQIMFAAVDSFLFSSFGFLFIGALIDVVKNTRQS